MTLSASTFRGKPSDNIFVGIMPEDSVKELIADLYTDLRLIHQLHANPRPKRNLHITLQLLPHLNHEIELAKQACEAISRRVTPFPVRLGQVMSFKNSKAFVLTKDQNPHRDITFFQRLLEAKLLRQSVHIKRKSFTPHVTLAYEPNVAPQSVKPIGWTIDHFFLIHSHDGESYYEILGRWPLTGPDLPSAIRTETKPPDQPELALF